MNNTVDWIKAHTVIDWSIDRVNMYRERENYEMANEYFNMLLGALSIMEALTGDRYIITEDREDRISGVKTTKGVNVI
jgi:hypothetical protein